MRTTGSYYHQILLDSISEGYFLEAADAGAGVGWDKGFWGIYLECYIS